MGSQGQYKPFEECTQSELIVIHSRLTIRAMFPEKHTLWQNIAISSDLERVKAILANQFDYYIS